MINKRLSRFSSRQLSARRLKLEARWLIEDSSELVEEIKLIDEELDRRRKESRNG